MAEQQQSGPGGHWSGTNRIPNIKQFVANRDKEKQDRDRQLDEQQKAQQSHRGDVREHKVEEPGIKGTQKTVTDPTTKRQVVIEDVNEEAVNRVKDPVVSFRSFTVRQGCSAK